MNYNVIIPAAGQGKRMGVGKNKLFLELNSEPIILHTVRIFLQDTQCKQVLLVINEQDQDEMMNLFANSPLSEKIHFIIGGNERQYSVYNGLQEVKNVEIVLVHDGARPFITSSVIHQLVEEAVKHGAAIAAVPVKDTIKKVEGQTVIETIERSSLWQVQTPQAFRVSLLQKAHQKAIEDQFLGTDEASLVERLKYPVQIVMSSYDNIKLTTLEDLYFAEAILKKRN